MIPFMRRLRQKQSNAENCNKPLLFHRLFVFAARRGRNRIRASRYNQH
jgi:hypothetical protein